MCKPVPEALHAPALLVHRYQQVRVTQAVNFINQGSKLPRRLDATIIGLPRRLYDAIAALDEKVLREQMKGLLSRAQIKAMLKRRDKILAKIDADREKAATQLMAQADKTRFDADESDKDRIINLEEKQRDREAAERAAQNKQPKTTQDFRDSVKLIPELFNLIPGQWKFRSIETGTV